MCAGWQTTSLYSAKAMRTDQEFAFFCFHTLGGSRRSERCQVPEGDSVLYLWLELPWCRRASLLERLAKASLHSSGVFGGRAFVEHQDGSPIEACVENKKKGGSKGMLPRFNVVNLESMKSTKPVADPAKANGNGTRKNPSPILLQVASGRQPFDSILGVFGGLCL